MLVEIVETPEYYYIECLPESGRIASEADALELVAACGENQVHRLLLHASNLTDDFYHLSSGLAGAVLQKFVTYSIKVAAVLTPELVNQGRFKDMVLEANRRNRLFHVFYDPIQAAAWLVEE